MATIVGSSVLAANCAARLKQKSPARMVLPMKGRSTSASVSPDRRSAPRCQQKVVDPKRDVQHLQRCGQVDPVRELIGARG